MQVTGDCHHRRAEYLKKSGAARSSSSLVKGLNSKLEGCAGGQCTQLRGRGVRQGQAKRPLGQAGYLELLKASKP